MFVILEHFCAVRVRFPDCGHMRLSSRNSMRFWFIFVLGLKGRIVLRLRGASPFSTPCGHVKKNVEILGSDKNPGWVVDKSGPVA